MKPSHLSFALALIVPLVYLATPLHQQLMSDPTLIKSASAEIYATGLLLLVLILTKLSDNVSTVRVTNAVGATLLIYMSLSVLWAENFAFFTAAWLKWISAAIVFCLGITVAQSVKNVERIIQTFVYSIAVVAFIGLYQHYSGWDYLIQSAAPGSTFSNRNLAGHVVVIALPLCFFNILRPDAGLLSKIINAFILASLFVYAYHIRAAGTWVAIACELMLGIVLLAWWSAKTWRNTGRRLSVFLVVSSLALLILVTPIFGSQSLVNIFGNEITGTLTKIQSADGSTGNRVDFWQGALLIIRDSPFIGGGLGNYFEYWSNGGYIQQNNLLSSIRAHNDILELTADLGMIGLFIFGSFFVLIVATSLRIIQSGEIKDQVFASVVLMSLAGFSISSLVSFPLQLAAPLISLSLLTGLLLGRDHDPQLIKIPTIKLRKFKLPLLLTSATLTVTTVTLNYQWLSDMEEMSQRYNDGTQLTSWRGDSLLMHPLHINLLRAITVGNLKYGGFRQANSFMAPLLEYWPDEPLNLALATEVQLSMNEVGQAETFARKLRQKQPSHSLSAEHYLLAISSRKMDGPALRALYQDLKAIDRDLIKSHVRHLRVLHCLAVLFGDRTLTASLYDDYLASARRDYLIEANMVIHLANVGDLGTAKTRVNDLKVFPEHQDVWQFQQIITASASGSGKALQPLYRQTFDVRLEDPIVYLF